MSDNSVPLTIISSQNTQYLYATIGIGKNILTQHPPQRGYWFVVLDRSNLNVVYNQVQTAPNVAPNLGSYNTADYILLVATIGTGLDVQPQGDLFNFLDVNGGGRELRRIEQVSLQFGCGTMGTFAYALAGILGNQNQPGFEASLLSSPNIGPILTIQLMPFQVGGKTVYTPVQLSNA
jgi:hypothetical protein